MSNGPAQRHDSGRRFFGRTILPIEMTKDEALKRLSELAARQQPGFARDRSNFTAWGLEAEHLFARLFDSRDPLLLAFGQSVKSYRSERGDLLHNVHTVIGAFEACKSVLEKAFAGEIDARLAQDSLAPDDPSARSNAAKIRLFISHASADAHLAELVLKLLRSAFALPASDIRCTSVDGSRLAGGADTDEQIRTDLRDADLVVGIISLASLGSLYVAFELGARWGLGKSLIPLMAPGVSPSDITGPLGGKNALRADSAGQLQQFVADVAAELNITLQRAASYQRELEEVLALRPAAGDSPWDKGGEATGERCPGCGKSSYFVVRTEPHLEFGDLGGRNHYMRCKACGFEDTRLVTK